MDENDCYLLGFLYADGCIFKNYINIRLGAKDREHLLVLRDLFYPTVDRPLYYIKSTNAYHLQVSSKLIVDRLRSLGCTERKSLTITFPDFLNNIQYQHFLRGYFDGDGCIYVNKNRSTSNVNIISSHIFCDIASVYISDTLNINARHISHSTSDKISVIKIDGNRQVLKFMDYIYNDATVFLKRKYEIYTSLKSQINKLDNKESRKCSICDNPHDAKGYCYQHYYQYITKMR